MSWLSILYVWEISAELLIEIEVWAQIVCWSQEKSLVLAHKYFLHNISDILRYKLNLKENIQQLLLIYLIRVYFNTNHRLLSQNSKGLLKLKIIDTDKKLQILSY